WSPSARAKRAGNGSSTEPRGPAGRLGNVPTISRPLHTGSLGPFGNRLLVVANCIQDADERGFPYMGNVPLVRMDPILLDRIDNVVGRLLDEVLKDFVWRCRVEMVRRDGADDAVFLPRPPELISLAGLDGEARSEVTLVYPDPPIGSEEQRLFEVIAPSVKLRSLTEWIAQSGVQA
ncbi:MAG: hypothetical protein ABII76_00490, partial [Pseudomonadota bacterium]